MLRFGAFLTATLLLAACSDLPQLGTLLPGREAPPEAPEEVGAPEPLPEAATLGTAPPAEVTATPAALDTVSETEKDAARAEAATSTGGPLGEVTVALGDPTDTGLWVKSSLVDSEQPGTVRTGDGEAIAVTLRPLGGGAGGAQISLSALQALGLSLTGLHPVTLARST